VDEVRERVAALLAQTTPDIRVLVGICGPPGSGKSTSARRLARQLRAPLVPMDGYHLPNDELDRLGLRQVKGAPETFDAAGFVALVRALRAAAHDVDAPVFDRRIDAARPAGMHVARAERLVVVEGNYLLLDEPPWDQLADLFDLTVYLDVPIDELRRRLVRRHTRFGRSPGEARAFVESSDLANAARIAASRSRADVVVPFLSSSRH